MPLFRDSRPDDLLIRYLLGALQDAETERLDEQSLTDDDFADRLRVAEDDLIDTYVRGTLTGELRERFESYYLASPRRRDKVAFARRFLAVVGRSSSPLHALAAAPAPAVPEPRRTWTFRLVLAAAAGLVITSSVLLTNDARLRRDLRQAESQTADAQSHVNALSAQLQDAQKAADLAAQTRSDAPATTEPGGGVALVLSPQTRGVVPVPIVAIESVTVSVTLDLQAGRRSGDAYAAALRDPATNRIIWRGAATPNGLIHDVVTVRVPAAVLHAQHYVIELSASHAGATPAFVDSYAFEVVR